MSKKCCNKNRGEPVNCAASPNGEHCWHMPNYGMWMSVVPPEMKCCHCGCGELSLHGPYHPNKTTISWSNGTTSGTYTLKLDGNTLNSATTLSPANGSTITWTTPTVVNGNGNINTSGYSQVLNDSNISCTVYNCPMCRPLKDDEC